MAQGRRCAAAISRPENWSNVNDYHIIVSKCLCKAPAGMPNARSMLGARAAIGETRASTALPCRCRSIRPHSFNQAAARRVPASSHWPRWSLKSQVSHPNMEGRQRRGEARR